MFTHNFDHPLYSRRWALSDWFQFYLKTQSCLVDLHLFWSTYCLEYPGHIQKKRTKIWILLYTMIKVKRTMYKTLICCRFGNFITHLPNMFTFMHLKCKLCWLINWISDLFLSKYAQFGPPGIFHHVDINWTVPVFISESYVLVYFIFVLIYTWDSLE